MFTTEHLHSNSDNHTQPEERGAGPDLQRPYGPFARCEEKPGTQHQEQRQVHIEDDVEYGGAKIDHVTTPSRRISVRRAVMRQMRVAATGTAKSNA